LIAAIALLVNLLAAGGITYPSVADSLWLLLAIELNRCGIGAASRDALRASNWSRGVPVKKNVRWTVGMILAGLLAIAIWLEYLPVMGCRLQLGIADTNTAAGRTGPSRDALEAALSADPWSVPAATRLAAQRFADYEALPTSTQLRSLADADVRARQLAPRRSSVWAQSADFAAAIYNDTRNVEYRTAAIRYFERAIDLYPTNANLHAEAARFWQSAGESERAHDAAAEALRLDDATRAAGHQDRVFEDMLRQELKSLSHPTR
jgi:tetratricopeptide (TPR) repeat protein